MIAYLFSIKVYNRILWFCVLFQAPLPPKKWQGVFQATLEGDQCPQKFVGLLTSLDCLSLNVYVPAFPRKPLPVMVFIHGGGFTVGSGGKLVYGPEFIVRKDVILVTFNYRLGALGFLCLRTKEVPGNAGLKDQVAALRWVKKNIEKFGGDPDNITLFGESAGGVSVSYMIATNITDGLFQRAIVQSGSSLANWGANREPLWSASLYAEALGYKPKDHSDLNKIFAEVPTSDLLSTVVKKPWTPFYDTQMIHLPCVEIPIPGEEAVILDLPHNLIKNTKKKISVIYGLNNKEGVFIMKAENFKDMYRRNEGYLFASDLGFENNDDAKTVAREVKQFYYGDEPVTLENVKSVIKLYTDLYFDVPESLEANIILSNTDIIVYNYNFRYDGYRNYVKYISGFRNETGASHGDDLFYLFDARVWPFPITKQDRLVIDLMTTMWTNYAKYG